MELGGSCFGETSEVLDQGKQEMGEAFATLAQAFGGAEGDLGAGQQPVFSGCRMIGGAVCERLFDLGLCLPSGSAMTDDDVARVVGVVRGCCNCKNL